MTFSVKYIRGRFSKNKKTLALIYLNTDTKLNSADICKNSRCYSKAGGAKSGTSLAEIAVRAIGIFQWCNKKGKALNQKFLKKSKMSELFARPGSLYFQEVRFFNFQVMWDFTKYTFDPNVTKLNSRI